MKLFASLFLLSVAVALDVQLESFDCDEALPFYALDLSMKCNGETRCTFGESAVIYGELVYNGTLDSGIMDDTVYATSSLQFMTLEYRLFEDLPLNMCGKWVLEISQNDDAAAANNRRRLADAAGDDAAAAGDDAAAAGDDAAAAGDDAAVWDDDFARDDACPEDGTYAFQVGYTLPNADDQTSWLATGWAGSGEIAIFTDKYDSSSLSGYCTLKLATMVTPSSEQKYNMPSAFVASIASVSTIAAILLLCIYCTCCRSAARKPRNQEYLQNDPIEMDRSHSDLASYQEMGKDSKSGGLWG